MELFCCCCFWVFLFSVSAEWQNESGQDRTGIWKVVDTDLWGKGKGKRKTGDLKPKIPDSNSRSSSDINQLCDLEYIIPLSGDNDGNSSYHLLRVFLLGAELSTFHKSFNIIFVFPTTGSTSPPFSFSFY